MEKHKSQTGCTEGDAQAASQSITRSGGLAAVIVVGRHAFTKRKLILEREKKADRLTHPLRALGHTSLVHTVYKAHHQLYT